MDQQVPSPEVQLRRDVETFLDADHREAGPVYNEHSLQLELGCFLRGRGYSVEFERPFATTSLPGSTRKAKRELDMLVVSGEYRSALELKVPLAGRVPETMYDFCADIEFVEGLVRARVAERGMALLVTDEGQFWRGEPRGIYEAFRRADAQLSGIVVKPTGAKDSTISLSGRY